jgi:flagellin
MKLNAAVNRTRAALTNVQNATSFSEVQDGGLQAAAKIVDRMAELKALSLDVLKSSTDVANYNTEFQSLRVQLNDIGSEKFNGVSLFSALAWGHGTVAAQNYVEVLTSERGSTGSKVSLAKINLLSSVTVKGQTVDTYVVATHTDSNSLAATSKGAGTSAALGDFTVDSFILALQNISTLRAENGATVSRLAFAEEHLRLSKSNLQAANSRIIDVDIAEETTQLAKYNILVQASASMLAQANMAPNTALMLLS